MFKRLTDLFKSKYKSAVLPFARVNNLFLEGFEMNKQYCKFCGFVMPQGSCINAQCTGTQFNTSGSKYLRKITGAIDGKVDVYAVLLTFNVKCPARQHAIKKLLCTGLRDKGSVLQDLKEARDAIDRAIQIESDGAL